MKKITVRNSFHDAEYTFHVHDEKVREFPDPLGNMIEVKLTANQVRAGHKALCGMDCTCGGLWRAGEQIETSGPEKYCDSTWVFPVKET